MAKPKTIPYSNIAAGVAGDSIKFVSLSIIAQRYSDSFLVNSSQD